MQTRLSDALLARRKRGVQASEAAPALTANLTHPIVQRAMQDPTRLLPSDVATLQRTIGNRAVARLLHGGGTPVSAADDRFEQEADRIVATRFGDAPAASSAGAPAGVQRAAVGPEGGVAGRDVERRLRATANSGSSLPETVRRPLESKLGADLSGVKVHTGNQAVQLARDVGAKAFTHKNHIYYGAGQSPADLRLTAHEAVHTLQQGAAVADPQGQTPALARSAGAGPVGVASAPAGAIQRQSWWERRKRRKKNMGDTDVAEYTAGEGGTANRVDKVRYNRGIGKSKEKFGFFKPNAEKGMGDRSVASSRLDKWLGTNVLAEEVWAEHNGEKGSVSAKVAGKPLFERQFNTPTPQDFDINMVLDPSEYKRVGDTYMQHSSDRFMAHDFSNPVTQKGLSDLQLLDAITGQADRHGGNIYIDPVTGEVKGIDNDLAFRKGESLGAPYNKYHDLPDLVDAKTAKMILKKKAKNLPKVLRSQYGGGITDEEITATQARFRQVKAHLKQLKRDKKLVKNWDSGTYLQQLSEADRSNKMNTGLLEASYLKRSINQYVGATDRELPDEEAAFINNPLAGVNPFYEDEKF